MRCVIDCGYVYSGHWICSLIRLEQNVRRSQLLLLAFVFCCLDRRVRSSALSRVSTNQQIAQVFLGQLLSIIIHERPGLLETPVFLIF